MLSEEAFNIGKSVNPRADGGGRAMEYAAFEALLKAHEVSVYQVSKATGIAASTFSDWKRGRSMPKADKLALIADFWQHGL